MPPSFDSSTRIYCMWVFPAVFMSRLEWTSDFPGVSERSAGCSQSKSSFQTGNKITWRKSVGWRVMMGQNKHSGLFSQTFMLTHLQFGFSPWCHYFNAMLLRTQRLTAKLWTRQMDAEAETATGWGSKRPSSSAFEDPGAWGLMVRSPAPPSVWSPH